MTTQFSPSVQVADLPDDEEQYRSLYNTEPTNIGLVTDYYVTSQYFSDGHKWVLGITSPNGFQGASVACVQLAAKTLLWVLDWTACRTNGVAKIPDTGVLDTNWVLLDEHYETPMWTVAADGFTPLYRISGQYIYFHKNPATVTINNLTFPQPPWLEGNVSRTVSPSVLDKNIALAGAGIPGAIALG